jgi:RNAse (barnase) inhibitor barstar
MTIAEQLAGGRPPGVYRWVSDETADAVRREVEQAGWNFVRLGTGAVDSKAAFLDACAVAFDLPDWFGRNWDALADSLADRSGEPELVLWEGWADLHAGDRDAFDLAIEIFSEVPGQLRILLREDDRTPRLANLTTF